MANSLTQYGITWTFDQDIATDTSEYYQYGTFNNGDYWIVKVGGGDVTIIGIDPISEVDGGRTRNGSMINPSATNGTTHGWDTGAAGTYSAALNVALDVAPGDPLVISPSSSLVSSISIEDLPNWPALYTAAVLTILSSEPAANSFRPPYSGSDKTVNFNTSDLDYNLLANLTTTASVPTLSAVARSVERVWLDHMNGNIAAWLNPDQNMPDYGKEMSTVLGDAALMLQSDFTDNEKEPILIGLIQIGIDNYAVLRDGGQTIWHADGGIASGRKFPILFAGIMLDDTDMKAIGDKSGDYLYDGGYGPGDIPPDYDMFGEDDSTFHVTADDVYSAPFDYNFYGGRGSVGTITVTNGSDIVQGHGSNFTSGVIPGDNIAVLNDEQRSVGDGINYGPEVLSVQNDEQLTLTAPYTGSTDTVSYIIAKFVGLGHINLNKSVDFIEWTTEDIGTPAWGITHAALPKQDGVDWDAGYRVGTAPAWPGWILATHIMESGSGAKALWNHDALFDYMDRYMEITDNGAHSVWTAEMWIEHRADYGTVWSGIDTPPPSTVPDVVGATEEQAEGAIEAEVLEYATTYEYSLVVIAGIVISQYPDEGIELPEGSTVDIVVSLGPDPARSVPNVIDLLQAAAEEAITGEDLIVGDVTSEYTDAVELGCVIRQDPVEGIELTEGDPVHLVMSLGAQPPEPSEPPEPIIVTTVGAFSYVTVGAFSYVTLEFVADTPIAFTMPANVLSVSFQVTAGTVVRRNEDGTSADGWTLQNGLPQRLDMRSLEGEVIYFTGTEGAVMEINWITGLAS